MRAALFALLLAVPAAQAAIQADSLSYDASSTFDGHLSLLQLRADEEGAGSPWVEVQAGRIEAVQYNSTSFISDVATGPGPQQPVVYPDPHQAPTRTPYDFGAGQMRLVAFRGLYRLNAFSSGPMGLHAEASRGVAAAKEDLKLSQTGLSAGDGSGADCPDARPDAARFCAIERAGSQILHASAANRASAILRAPDMVLELSGLDLQVDAARSLVLQSGHFAEEVAPVSGTVHRDHEVFLRLYLTDAVVTVATDGPSGALLWAAGDLASQHDGPVAFASATGVLATANGQVRLDHERFVAPAGAHLILRPADASTFSAELETPPAPAPSGLVAIPVLAAGPAGLVFALAAFVAGLAWFALRGRGASLDAMEAAIAAGENRRAARVAAAILRRLPGHEDARLGRAIALTRAGSPGRAAREVERHLRRAEPTDGSLHYVMGLALLDKGRDEEGRAALREAVRRTPELEADVRARAFDVLPQRPARPSFLEASYV